MDFPSLISVLVAVAQEAMASVMSPKSWVEPRNFLSKKANASSYLIDSTACCAVAFLACCSLSDRKALALHSAVNKTITLY